MNILKILGEKELSQLKRGNSCKSCHVSFSNLRTVWLVGWKWQEDDVDKDTIDDMVLVEGMCVRFLLLYLQSHTIKKMEESLFVNIACLLHRREVTGSATHLSKNRMLADGSKYKYNDGANQIFIR